MEAARTIEVPAHAMRFAARVDFDAIEKAKNGSRRFSGVLYGGGVITDHGWWDAVAFDLSSLSVTTPLPLLLQHDSDRSIGVVDWADASDGSLRVAGMLFTGIEPEADKVAAKADAGMPWQMSVGIFPGAIEEVQAGAVINGRTVDRSTHVFRRSRVREGSFVAVGADASTSAAVFNAGGTQRVPLITHPPQEPHMSDDTNQAALAAMTTERDTEKARADAAETKLAELQGQFAAQARAERETAVKALLGDEFSAEAAEPYMSMQPAQFAAVQARETAMRRRLPGGFTAEQATAGAGCDALHNSPLLASARQMFGIKA